MAPGKLKSLQWTPELSVGKEVYLRKIGYPDIQSHCKEHNDFAFKVAMFNVDTMDKKESAPGKLVVFIAGWWENHIKVSDRAYRKYAEEQGVLGNRACTDFCCK